MIEALTRLHLDDPKLEPAVRWLLAQRRDGHWQTTQETSMSLSALTDYLAAAFEHEGNYTYTVCVNGKAIATMAVTPQTLGKHGLWRIPIGDLGNNDPVVEITRSAGPGAPLPAGLEAIDPTLATTAPGPQPQRLASSKCCRCNRMR